MQARIETLSRDLRAIGSSLTVGVDGRLGCACSGGRTAPTPAAVPARVIPLDTST